MDVSGGALERPCCFLGRSERALRACPEGMRHSQLRTVPYTLICICAHSTWTSCGVQPAAVGLSGSVSGRRWTQYLSQQ